MTKTLAFLLSASLAACAGEAEVQYSGAATAPELVAMDDDPSVMVVANSDEPIFFSDNSYWLYRDNHWLRSRSHRGGWARVDQPPEHIRRIERPTAYVHFRHGATAPRATYNDRGQPLPPARPEPRERPEARERPDAPMPAEVQPPPGRAPSTPSHEPNPQGPVQPYANPRPPQQVPPVSPGQHDGPDHQIAPDPARAPTSPGMQNRARDQRPAADRDDHRDDRRDDHDPVDRDKP
jgi:hypothetical protein